MDGVWTPDPLYWQAVAGEVKLQLGVALKSSVFENNVNKEDAEKQLLTKVNNIWNKNFLTQLKEREVQEGIHIAYPSRKKPAIDLASVDTTNMTNIELIAHKAKVQENKVKAEKQYITTTLNLLSKAKNDNNTLKQKGESKLCDKSADKTWNGILKLIGDYNNILEQRAKTNPNDC